MIDQVIDINYSDALWKENSEIKNSLPKQIFLKDSWLDEWESC